jgi:hypothetical protein
VQGHICRLQSTSHHLRPYAQLLASLSAHSSGLSAEKSSVKEIHQVKQKQLEFCSKYFWTVLIWAKVLFLRLIFVPIILLRIPYNGLTIIVYILKDYKNLFQPRSSCWSRFCANGRCWTCFGFTFHQIRRRFGLGNFSN